MCSGPGSVRVRPERAQERLGRGTVGRILGPERKHIGGTADFVALRLLGREVFGSAEGRPGGGQPGGLHDPRDAEIEDAWDSVGHEDVARFQIPVYEPADMDGLERLGQRCPERPQLLFRMGP
ncbi:hypothetical protein GCM10023080_080360 [Streptomyces pseudoechinosporeus]